MSRNDAATRFAFIAVLGAPNAGKSTLVNALTGTKVSIVSPKVQTTRARIRGIAMAGNAQLALVDTPGIFKPGRRLDRAMVSAAWDAAGESDARLLLVDAKRGIDADTDALIRTLEQNRQKTILVINKIDLVKKDALLPLIAALAKHAIFTDTFPVSAQTGENIAELKQFLADAAPEGPWMFPADDASDIPARLFAAEITREKLFLLLQKELPYHVSVSTDAYREEKNAIRIEQTIIVGRAAHKPIVVGRKGEMIKKIGESARRELTRLLGTKVNLFLFVKVQENWTDDPAQYAAWGLDYNA
ncbi:MAG: GTPase Era [Alphaproteobacteria bacterium]|nr:GTPase Era [Alphaproteobacteria bacterium]